MTIIVAGRTKNCIYMIGDRCVTNTKTLKVRRISERKIFKTSNGLIGETGCNSFGLKIQSNIKFLESSDYEYIRYMLWWLYKNHLDKHECQICHSGKHTSEIMYVDASGKLYKASFHPDHAIKTRVSTTINLKSIWTVGGGEQVFIKAGKEFIKRHKELPHYTEIMDIVRNLHIRHPEAGAGLGADIEMIIIAA